MSNNEFICPDCGKSVSGLNREVRFLVPDDLADIWNQHGRKNGERVSLDGDDFVTLDRERYFVRVILPVQLDIDHTFHFGVWLESDAADVKRAHDAWYTDEYADLELSGTLANAVPPWGDTILNAPATTRVTDKKSIPFIVGSIDKALNEVLTRPWSVHECEQVIDEIWSKDMQ